MNNTELRELDAWIAEHVFGLKINANGMIETWPRPNERHDECVADYTTDTAAAMQVLEKCIERTPQTICFGRYHKPDEPKRYVVHLGGTWEKTKQDGETLPLAICKFAKALFSKETH